MYAGSRFTAINQYVICEHVDDCFHPKLECGPMPNVMAAQPNIGGALCESSVMPFLLPRRKVSLTPSTIQCRAVTKLKLAGVPKTTGPISAASRPKFTVLWEHVEQVLLLNKFFSDCRYMPSLQRYSRTKLWDGAEMAILATFLGPAFAASRVQQVSDVHSKFALGPHHV